MTTVLSWKTEKRKVKDLIPADYNPRQMTEKQAKELEKSLKKFGLVEIPAIDLDNTLLAGHMRMATMIQLGRGEEEIDVRVPNRKLTDAEAKEYNLRSNKNTGEWDMDKLFAMPEGLLEEVGWDKKEIQKIIDGHTTVTEDDYNPEEGLKQPVRVHLGEIWQLGTHRLMCGDSTKREDVERLMDGKKADMVFTDPPYGVKRDKGFEGFEGFGGFGKPIARKRFEDDDWDSERPAKECFDLILECGQEGIIFGGNFFADLLPKSTHWIVWDKKQTMPTFGDCELAWTSLERKSVKKYEVVYNGLIGKEAERFHPTQKPLKLFVPMIEDYTEKNQSLFDPFGGSGSTLIACEQTKRKCYMMELDPKYCTVILDRWEKLTGKKAIKIS